MKRVERTKQRILSFIGNEERKVGNEEIGLERIWDSLHFINAIFEIFACD